jgi:hypothetical protein
MSFMGVSHWQENLIQSLTLATYPTDLISAALNPAGLNSQQTFTPTYLPAFGNGDNLRYSRATRWTCICRRASMKLRKTLWLAAVSALVAGAVAVSTATTEAVAANGGWSAVGGGIDGGRVFQIVRLPDGRLYAGGTFTSARNNGTSVPTTGNIASWDPTTSAWSALGAGLNGGVYSLAFDETSKNLWIGGAFTNLIARWNTSDSAAVATTLLNRPTGYPTWQGVETIAVLGTNDVLIGGGITLADDLGRGLIRFDGTNYVPVAGGITSTSNPVGSSHDRIVNRIVALSRWGRSPRRPIHGRQRFQHCVASCGPV